MATTATTTKAISANIATEATAVETNDATKATKANNPTKENKAIRVT